MFENIVSLGYEIIDIREDENSIVFGVIPRYSHKESFSLVYENLPEGFIPIYRKTRGGYEIRILKRERRERKISKKMNLALLIATTITTTWAGYAIWAEGDIKKSIIFSISLMSILGIHELAHALTAKKEGIRATLPIFIPVPPPIFPFGTLGAVIFMNSPVRNRGSLIKIGISGPIAGFCLSVPLSIIGIYLSQTAPPSSIGEEGFILGPSLLFYLVTRIIFGEMQDKILLLHPLAIAGWAGLFVTSLNLIPVGQLDGGHVIRGIAPMKYKYIYLLTMLFLLIMGFIWPGWFVWAIVVYFLTKSQHPGPLDDVSEPTGKEKMMLGAMVLMLLLSFMPIPIAPATYIQNT